ncbi:MAG: 23S rRNA (uracil(1939)-C(5))-methyltransferase RlmD [Erysipelotrichales bacterium]|nr:23S rRNA (uracil(1939)-C(5))-methyltransferase RlmD [Erysipelotrichales bacterium]
MPTVTIAKISANGEGIGFEKSTPILLYGTVPGDIAEYKIESREPKLIRGKLIRIVKPGPARIKSPCAHSSDCEGCPLIMCDYDAQLDWKREELVSNLRRFTDVSEDLIEDVISNPNITGYRNLVKLPVMMSAGKLVCGMYKRNSNCLVPVRHCVIHEPDLERVRKEVLEVLNKHGIKAYDRKTKEGLRTLYLRGMSGKYQLALIGGKKPYTEECTEDLMKIPGMNSIYQNIQTTHNPVNIFGKQSIHLAGTKALSFKIGKIHLCLSMESFFQMNTAQAEKLYEIAVGMIPEDTKHLVEAYCGIGAMSFLAKDKAGRITGIEFMGSSIRDAKEALKRNDAKNLSFVVGDAAEEFRKISKKGPVDVLLADPPRTGLNDEMIQTIRKSGVKTIIYVSCNPYTLAKNIAELKEYEVKRVVPVDIFSGTPHIETVVLMSQRGQR